MVQQRCIDKECFIVEKLGPSIIYGFDPWPPSTILSVLPSFVIFLELRRGPKSSPRVILPFHKGPNGAFFPTKNTSKL